MGWTSFLFAYLLGGLTFLPLALCALLAHAYYTFPHRPDVEAEERPEDSIVQPGDDVTALREAQKEQQDDAKSRFTDTSEVSAGYFAVCREYMPMGINAKPIERATPVGSATVAAPSQSVYQAMYRSIFDRKQTPGPLDNNGNISQRPKNAGNVFYVVLRHGHIMLFDDKEQLEVRHVVSLAHHDVSIYSGGDVTPEGELFIKKNAICLTRSAGGVETSPDTHVSKPFYLFSENCSAKEDFYFALLRNQEQSFTEREAPVPLQFDVKNMISLVEKLHRSEDHGHSRWLNAMIGRVFLSLYKTKDLENLVREKLTKKISRVKRPSFLSHIAIRSISPGESAPYISNPRLKDLNVEGECVMEADVRYTGNFRIEVAATARIELGARFKAREVNLVLAVVLRKIEGHCLFKIKPPPSNRIWFTFQTMPKMEMTIEPIVSSRQITYTVILRQIENRIKEVFTETLVFPYWDDIPFFRTEHKKWRGGIWEGDDAVVRSADAETIAAQVGDVDALHQLEDQADILGETRPMEKSLSVPNIQGSPTTGLFGRKIPPHAEAGPKASSTSVDTTGSVPPGSSWPTSARSSAEALVATDVAKGENSSSTGDQPVDAATATLSAVSSAPSQPQTPVPSPVKATLEAQKASSNESSSSTSTGSEVKTSLEEILNNHARRNTASSAESTDSANTKDSVKAVLKSHTGSISRGFFKRQDSGSTIASGSSTNADGTPKRNTLQAVTNAAAQARQWGWNAIQRQKEARNGQHHQHETHPPVDLNQPMGRGRPLPPPGIPLPPPDKKSKVTPIQFPKRKPLAPPLLPERSHRSHYFQESPPKEEGRTPEREKRPVPPPPLPKRRHSKPEPSETSEDNMLVVPAPSDSEPGSPVAEHSPSYFHPTVEDATDEGEPLKVVASESSETPDLKTPRGSISQRTSEPSKDSLSTTVYEEPENPITALPVEDESDDGYSGWMEDSNFDVEVPKEAAATEEQ